MPSDEILARSRAIAPLAPDAGPARGNGPAAYYRFAGAPGTHRRDHADDAHVLRRSATACGSPRTAGCARVCSAITKSTCATPLRAGEPLEPLVRVGARRQAEGACAAADEGRRAARALAGRRLRRSRERAAAIPPQSLSARILSLDHFSQTITNSNGQQDHGRRRRERRRDDRAARRREGAGAHRRHGRRRRGHSAGQGTRPVASRRRSKASTRASIGTNGYDETDGLRHRRHHRRHRAQARACRATICSTRTPAS